MPKNSNMADNGIISESEVNSPEPGFLGCIAPSIERHAFQDKAQYIELFESKYKAWFQNRTTDPDIFLLTNVTNDIFQQIFLPEDDRDNPVACYIAYDSALNILLIRKGLSLTHAHAAGAFDIILFEAIELTGFGRRQFKYTGSALCQAEEGGKGAAKAWVPTRPPPGRKVTGWPSAVLEVAFSETQSKLQADIRYWQRASAGQVRIVFAMQIGRARTREIKIEQWVFNDDHGRYHRQGFVTIRRLQDGTTRVRGAPLTVGFEDFVLRAPAIPKEHTPIVVNEEMFVFMAEYIWSTQDEEEEEERKG